MSCNMEEANARLETSEVNDFRLLPPRGHFHLPYSVNNGRGEARPSSPIGAGEGNRTLVISLEGCCSTIELHPRTLPSRQVHSLI